MRTNISWHQHRPALIAKRMIDIARIEKADAIAHGATGKATTRCVLS